MRVVTRLIALTVPVLAVAAMASPASAKTCSAYKNQAAAQRAADTRDADHDGVYCEKLPCPCSHAKPKRKHRTRAVEAAAPAREIRRALSEFKSALRHRNGQRACDLMTARQRAAFRREYDELNGWDSCRELVEVQGAIIYRSWRKVRIGRPVTNAEHGCAPLLPREQGAMFFARGRRGWQLDDVSRDSDTSYLPERCR